MKKIRLIAVLLIAVMLLSCCALAEDMPEITYDLSNLENFTELSQYYFGDLQTAVDELGLMFFYDEEGIKVYGNEYLLVCGTDVVTTIVLGGGEYTIYGAAAGMDYEDALNRVREYDFEEIEPYVYEAGVTFIRSATEESIVNWKGYDSFIMCMPMNDILSTITWMSYSSYE